MRWLLFFLLPAVLGFSDYKASYGNCKEADRKVRIVERDLVVNGRSSKVFELLDEEGSPIIKRTEGECFNVFLENQTTVPTTIHWHGLVLPVAEDGVAYVTQPPIPPGKSQSYNFEVVQAGSYWAHSHYGIEEQKLMAVPLILLPKKKDKMRDIILFMEDFSFRTPEEIWKTLRKDFVASGKGPDWIPNLEPPKKAHAPIDINDVEYDAYLTNRKTLEDPDIYQVKPGEKIRLRIINGSATSNFHVFMGELKGDVVAVDGEAVEPLPAEEFPIATAQRVDVIVTIPRKGGVFPVVSQEQGTKMLTGVVLTTEKGSPPKRSSTAKVSIGAITNHFEKLLRAKNPLAKRAVNRKLDVILEGNMKFYVWAINHLVWPNNQPLYVKEGERVEISFVNKTSMAHPMHLHGHVFQVVEIDGDRFSGAMRDTVLVMPNQTVKVIFDANNPGIWAMHCHILYHLWGGMFTVVQYEGYTPPKFTKQQVVDYSRIYGGY